MNSRHIGPCALALMALLPASGHAQEAFTRQAANVRAGPDRSYPLVARLGPGAPLRVMGCLDDWTWCDVAFDDNRGWVYGPFLLYDVPGDRVPLYTYGPSLGIAIIGFSIGGYWDEHYRQRPWYGGRGDWERRGPPEHRAPEGLPPHAVYTRGMHADHGDSRPAGRGSARAPDNAPHAESQAAHEAPRTMQHAPTQHAPTQQRAPQQNEVPPHATPQHEPQQPQSPQRASQQREAPQQHESAPQHPAPQPHESGQGRESEAPRGGGGKPEREGH